MSRHTGWTVEKVGDFWYIGAPDGEGHFTRLAQPHPLAGPFGSEARAWEYVEGYARPRVARTSAGARLVPPRPAQFIRPTPGEPFEPEPLPRRTRRLLVVAFVALVVAIGVLQAKADGATVRHPLAELVARSYRSTGPARVVCGRTVDERTSCRALVDESREQTAAGVAHVYAVIDVRLDAGRIVSQSSSCLGLVLSRDYPRFLSYLELEPRGSVKAGGGTLEGVRAVYQPALKAGRIYWTCGR